jgi:hypothetical protein
MEVNARPSHVHESHELSVEQLQCKKQQMLHFLNEAAQKCRPRWLSRHSLPETTSI